MLEPLVVGHLLFLLLLPGTKARLLCGVTNVTDTSAYSLYQVILREDICVRNYYDPLLLYWPDRVGTNKMKRLPSFPPFLLQSW